MTKATRRKLLANLTKAREAKAIKRKNGNGHGNFTLTPVSETGTKLKALRDQMSSALGLAAEALAREPNDLTLEAFDRTVRIYRRAHVDRTITLDDLTYLDTFTS